MDPFQAAHACRLLGVSHVLPGHYGTFPVLAGTPEQLRSELAGLGLADTVQVHDLEPGGTLA
jgi:L-ascorbate metabolism protein UlaG (beta-lactamase superfamily)